MRDQTGFTLDNIAEQPVFVAELAVDRRSADAGGSDDPVDVLLVIDMQYPGYDIDRDVVGVAVGWGFLETTQVPEVERVAGGAYMLDFTAGTYLRGFRFDVDDACHWCVSFH